MVRVQAVLNAPRATVTSAPLAQAAPVSAPLAQAAPVSAPLAQAAPAAPRWVAPPPVPEDDDNYVIMAPEGAVQAQSQPGPALDDAEDDLWFSMDIDIDLKLWTSIVEVYVRADLRPLLWTNKSLLDFA
jgi:hypothetical protein